jgi:hypothetical protein
MHSAAHSCRIGFPLALLLAAAPQTLAQDVTLVEKFEPGHAYKVDIEVRLTGRLAVPVEKGKPPKVVAVQGGSHLTYDERVLAPDEPGATKAVRAYRTVDFRRVVGDAAQEAGIRSSVRRMVVIKSGPRRAPFSPDGPLTWGEIDVVRTDVFLPTAVPGLLPPGPVTPGRRWRASPAAVAELTDMEKVDDGELTVEFVGMVETGGRRQAKLTVGGTVRGVNEDGPNRQRIDATAYFDPAANMLTYLSVKGASELLDGTTGQVVGTVEGKFEMTRAAVAPLPPDLSDASLRGLDLKPGFENTLLLYDNPDLGVRFLFPRSWRVGAVQGKQVTLDHARAGAGILITAVPPGKVPTADDYLAEALRDLEKLKGTVIGKEQPTRARPDPGQLDRFAVDAAVDGKTVRLDYAVLKQTDGGITAAATLPAAAAADLRGEVERVVRSLAVTRRIE